MAAKFATPELQTRMRKAVAAIGRGVNQANPSIELQGRKDLALVHIENQILLGRDYLTSADCQRLAELLFSTNTADTADTADDYTADATETNSEALALTPKARIDEDGDIDDEYDDEAEDL